MSSPPTTPPSELPKSSSKWRFHQTGTPCEWSEQYRPTGYHPVDLGDVFKDGQYKVIRKLGEGSFSTVWLAADSRNGRYVALKVCIARSSKIISSELDIYQRLGQGAVDDDLSKHIVTLLDAFDVTGPNGVHHCLVYEPMGSTATSFLNHLGVNKVLDPFQTKRYPKWMAKLILKQTLTGLAFLHKNGVIHGDVQPGNLLFSIPNLSRMHEGRLKQHDKDSMHLLERVDGKKDKWAPKYLTVGQPLHEYVTPGPDMVIKISDLASAFFSTDPPVSPVTPLALRAPELIFKETFDASIDIWAFGCLIYEFLTGTPLFFVSLMIGQDADDADDDHLLSLNDVLEPLPDAWLEKWSRADKWFGPNGERLEPRGAEEFTGAFVPEITIGDDQARWSPDEDAFAREHRTEGFHQEGQVGESEPAEDEDFQEGFPSPPPFDPARYPSEPFINKPLEAQFDKNKPDDIGPEEAKVVTDLIRQVLQYDPAKRPTAAQLLEHPWFKD
ncbi:MAG: hypothetical protein M1821_006576 [Bathelium mastoideum]|nr:MAG: hypothetical protein M1821_006576 [Bathelium mastoideum]